MLAQLSWKPFEGLGAQLNHSGGDPSPQETKPTAAHRFICAPSVVSPEQTGKKWAAGKQSSHLTFTCFLTEREMQFLTSFPFNTTLSF